MDNHNVMNGNFISDEFQMVFHQPCALIERPFNTSHEITALCVSNFQLHIFTAIVGLPVNYK